VKILVIGGSGYVGRYLIGYLAQKGYEVRIFDKVGPGNGYDIVYGDVRDINSVCEAARGCTAVVILSGIVGDPECEKNPELANDINHRAVAEICSKLSSLHIIYMSTCAVYGAQDILLHENSEVSPLSTYARTKLDGEKHVIAVGGTVFRLGSVYGVGRSDRIRMNSIVNFLTVEAILNHKFKIFGASQYKCIISVKDVAALIYEAIHREVLGLFNIASENYTLQGIANKIIGEIPDVEVEYLPALPNDRNYRVGMVKRNIYFDYHCQYSIESEVRELIKLYTERYV
jgi:nucleoside-diphosphate-sugar epimerase